MNVTELLNRVHDNFNPELTRCKIELRDYIVYDGYSLAISLAAVIAVEEELIKALELYDNRKEVKP